MNLLSKTGIIIQARTGSSRLPNKMILPFDKDRGIFELILDRIIHQYQGIYPIILATTTSKSDDVLADIATQKNISVVRGNENDVSSRFETVLKKYNLQNAIRVCADNPFLDVQHIKTLVDTGEAQAFDYVSFAFEDQTPVIKSHLGLFTEFVSLKALEKIRKLTDKPVYFEHVTNYIYTHPKNFSLKFLPLPKYLKSRKDIRLTLDTTADFKFLKNLYHHIKDKDLNIEDLVSWVDQQPELLQMMQEQIKKNSK